MKKFVLSLLLAFTTIIVVNAQESKSGYGFRWGAVVKQEADFGLTCTSINANIGLWNEDENQYIGLIAGYGFGSLYHDATLSTDKINVVPLLLNLSHTFFLGKNEKFGIVTGSELGAIFYFTYESSSERFRKSGVFSSLGLKLGLDFKIKQHDLQIMAHAKYIGLGLSIGYLF